MPLLLHHDKAVADWVASHIPDTGFFPPYTAAGFLDLQGHLTGGLVFFGFTGHAILLALAGPSSLSRAALGFTVDYVFGQLGCSRLEIRCRDKHVRRIVSKLGLRYEGTAKCAYGEARDGFIYSLTTPDLAAFIERWRLGGYLTHGQRSEAA